MSKKDLIISISIAVVVSVFAGVLYFLNYPTNGKPRIRQINKINGGGEIALSEQLANQSKIKKFKNYSELSAFLQANEVSAPTYGLGRMGGKTNLVEEMAPTTASPVAEKSVAQDSGMGAGGGGQDYSKTNIQVEGVDEADIVKNDGKYIYAVAQNDLFIVEAYPAGEAKILSKIAFKSRPQDIYINKDKLIVFGYDDQIYNMAEYQRFKRAGSFTFFKVFDISDRVNPKQVRDLNLEGSYFDSRMIGDYVYFVTSNYNYYFVEGEPVLPRIMDGGKVLSNDCGKENKCFAPDIYYFDIPYSYYNFTSITAINVQNNQEMINGDMYLLSGNQNMYVSPDNIYITYTKYLSEYQLENEVLREMVFPLLSSEDQDKISKIEATESFILSKDEKMYKIQNIVDRYISSLDDKAQTDLDNRLKEAMKKKYQDIAKELEKTVVHKININKNNVEYKNFGEVTGRVLNQFSMDEKDGYFRIATTKDQTWSRYEEENVKSYNNLYVLDADMKVVGSLEKMAEGEQIYSVRFMQNRAYMVTFKQTDPLFVIDLQDPKNPQVLGKLKIPGFSNYLHPYNDNILIGLGKEAEDLGSEGVKVKGLKLSLFDVSNVSEPKEIDSYILGDMGSDSAALYDHKAFLFSREKSLLAIPVTIRESTGQDMWGDITFSGAAIFNIDEKGFKLAGKIDHSDGTKQENIDYWDGYGYYDSTVKRVLYIDDVLYTLSNKYLKMNDLKNLDLLKSLELKKEQQGSGGDFEIIN